MKQLLIIYPHWPPSNLVGVHRVRLIANELHDLGWKATVLTVDPRDHEEPPAPETLQLVDANVEVIHVRANKVRHVFGRRLIGDIGLRGYSALKKKAHALLTSETFDFIWFSMPSWYPALMGRGLSRKHGVPFGIDYQDPWVYALADHQKGWNRASATIAMARILEPLALRGVSLVSGISEGYVEGVQKRYRNLQNVPFVTCQLGFSKRDHFIDLPDFKSPFTAGKRTYVYAGAHWSMGAPLFRLWLEALGALHQKSPVEGIEFLFIGTGNPELPSIQSMANELGLAGVVREIPDRLSYLTVQQILRTSDGALVIGSIEPHYSASKLFQCLVTAPRVFAFFHELSEGKEILADCQADDFYVPYNAHWEKHDMLSDLECRIASFINPNAAWNVDLEPLEAHSASNAGRKLTDAIQTILR